MKMKEATALRFKEFCNDRQIKYNKLARISGVSPSTVYSMMSPKRKNLSVIVLKELCDGLEITLVDFFNSEIFDNLELEIEE